MVVLGVVTDDPTHKPGDSVDHSRQQHTPGLPEESSPDWQSTSSPASSSRQMLGDHHNRYGSAFRSSSVTSSQTHHMPSSSTSNRNEGPLGLFKGAIPRFFWIAPLGAMNFAGYELAKKAMIQDESKSIELIQEKKTMVDSRG